jgi:superfamily I DNA and/or RNA helicase
LNPSQTEAIKKCLSSRDVSLIHGPPGTGKTTTLIEAARQLVEQGAKVLIATPSNAAADHVSLSLLKAGIKVVRAGNPVRISAELEATTTEGILKQSSDYQFIKESRKRADEFRRMAGKYKRNLGPEERAQRKLLMQEAHALTKDAVKMERMIIDSIYDQAEVITATLVGASNSIPSKLEFDFVFIDGGHVDPVPRLDIQNMLKLLKPGGYLCIDDYCEAYGREGVIEAYEESVANGQLKTIDIEYFENRGWVFAQKTF